jgi:methyl-accepting chemotaxis protein
VTQNKAGSGAAGAGAQVRLPPELQRRLPSAMHVLVGIGGLLVLLAVGVMVAVVLVFDVRDATRLADRHVEYASAIHVAALNAKAIANHERGFLLSGRREFLNEIETQTPEARAALLTAEHEAVGDSQRSAAYEASAGFERWLLAVEDEIRIFRAGDRRRALKTSLGPTRRLRKDYEATFARAQALGASAVESATSSVSSTSWRSVRILLVYSIIALAFGFAVTVWLVRMIVRPLSALLQELPEARDIQTVR